MAYFNKTQIQSADSPSIDAFFRLRISEPYAIFDNKQLYDTGSLVWATKVIGNATASFNPNNASVIMFASGSNSSIVRQSKKRSVYQSGKSQLIVTTSNFSGSAPNVIKRIGYFDQNNGIYFTSSGSSFGVGLRSNTTGTPVDTFISQSSWNLDKLDGTGPSGNTLNITSSQIFFKDIEWLGVGRIRYGVYHSGIPIYVHQITNLNTLNTVYMSTPNLPIRYEIINSGSTPQSMLHICSAVISEGGIDQLGAVKAISNPTALAINSTAYAGLIALRLKSSSFDSAIIPLNISTAQTTANCVYEATILLNPSGSLPWVWQDLPNSVVQYATASSNTYTIVKEGTKIFSGVSVGNQTISPINYDPTFALGSDVDGNQDILVLGWMGIAANAASAVVSLTWREIS